MKIAVPYENGQIFQHFGHAEQMKIYQVEEGRVASAQVLSTNGSGHGALAGFLRDQGVEVLICGGIGGGAQTALAQAGIKLYGGCSGPADRAVENLLNNTLMYDPDIQCSHHKGGDCGHACASRDGDDCRRGDCGGLTDDLNDQMITLTSTDEDGQTSEADFRVVAVYGAQGRKYIAMTPDLDAPELEADIYLFRFVEDGDLINVEEIADDEEFAAAADAFQSWQLSRSE